MEIVTEFTYPVREIEHCLIPLKDGTQLAARIWLPQDAGHAQAFPAILEYLPYRKRDGTAVRDALTHPWMAGQGYVCVRVDMRGNGESQGLMADEYLLQEQEDALEVIDWLCQQPWCDGNVGMMGISWGGFNGLQVAARQPQALKAIITLCSTDDRFADDIHYKGGNLLLENFGWAATMLNFQRGGAGPLAGGRRLENPVAPTSGRHAIARRNLVATPDP
ncbi:CocE/NonD family hydrolase [Pseudomonas poae]